MVVSDDRLRWRHVEDPCETCDGAGVQRYGNSSTWRSGMGAAATTVDVCDTCWGTGDRWRRGIDLRAFRGEEAGRVAKAAVTALADSVGVEYQSCRVDVDRIVQHLEALVDKRNTPYGLGDLAQALANVLRRGIGMPERKTR